jgi:chromosome segregation ATPase
MAVLPIITNNLGKIAAAAAAALSAVGYANRKTIGRWLAEEDDAQASTKRRKRKSRKTKAGFMTAAQGVRQFQGQMNRKQAELLSQMRTLMKDLRSKLDAQQTETAQLGKELRALRERQEKMEMPLRAAPGTSKQQPARRKTGNGVTRPTKPSMGDGAPPIPKNESSRAASRTSRTI